MEKITLKQVLREADEFFQSQDINILGSGYGTDIMGNSSLLSKYIDRLSEGCDNANSRAQMVQLLENTNLVNLKESFSTTGVAPLYSLSMPFIRALWPSTFVKDAFITEVPKTPRFTIQYQKPWLFDGTTKYALPLGLRNSSFGPSPIAQKPKLTGFIEFAGASGAAVSNGFATVNLYGGAGSGIVSDLPTITPDGSGKIDSVTAGSTAVAAKFAAGKEEPIESFGISAIALYVVGEAAEIAVDARNIKMNMYKQLVGKVALPASLGTGFILISGDFDADTNLANISVNIVRDATGATIAGDITGVVLSFGVSYTMERNYNSVQIGYDSCREEVVIPTGVHIDASVPIERVMDEMAMYNVDATQELINLMNETVAMKVDLDALDFLENDFAETEDADTIYMRAFDLKPQAQFAGLPQTWREELKPVIDNLAAVIINRTFLKKGSFTILANPIDSQLITNIRWEHENETIAISDGVEISYSIGTFRGSYVYRVISSQNVPAGTLTMIFNPSTNEIMTYKYYPYSFNIENNYRGAIDSNTPNIMVTKRETWKSYIKAQGKIAIYGNDGMSQNIGAVPRAAFTPTVVPSSSFNGGMGFGYNG